MKWTGSCREVAELLSRRFDEPLGWLDRARLRVHLAMCGNCLNVEQQLNAMRALSMEFMAGADDLDDPPPGATVAGGPK
jgi:hypothetical protein